MLENKKHVFWQALFVTVLLFLMGFVLGVYIEQLRSDSLSISFYQSEVSLYDSLALGKIIGDSSASCEDLKKISINFADRVYNEAKNLEKYDEKNKLTNSIKTIHKKYDLLRTLLWMNAIDIGKKCGKINDVVYLYEYSTNDIGIKSKQIVWERVLNDLKSKEGSNLILIPIAVDQDIESLSYLIGKYGIKSYPAVLINEKDILYQPKTIEEIGNYLK